MPVGERIELRRLQRRLSRRIVANLVGRSEEWLRLIESGRLRLDSVEVTLRLAAVLHIDDFRELIDRPVQQRRSGNPAAIDLVTVLRPAIMDHPALAANGEPAVANLPAELLRCEELWSGSWQRFTQTAQRLTPLLIAVRGRHWRTGGDSRELLIRAYHLCRQLLTAVGANDFAVLVADRAVAATAHHDRPTVLAAGAWHMAEALLHLEKPDTGRDFATAAERLIRDGDTAEEMVLRGALQLVTAKSVAALSDTVEADRLLAAAVRTARHLGGSRRALGIDFGPTEIALTRMEIALACHDFDKVIAAARGMDGAEQHLAGRGARYHIMVAAALAGRNDDMGAVFTLAKAAEISPEDLRYDSDVTRTLRHLLRQDNQLLRSDLARLTELADPRLGSVS
ncbi:helix-turn-helix domain-containing protein [Nocardia sp. NPDC052566]|uniref:helix-turn-helix domain-containing protein n=1 Tax=Nocardia sp. NPDC052566 TaxID=3364330 RepID=UPI0037C640AB